MEQPKKLTTLQDALDTGLSFANLKLMLRFMKMSFNPDILKISQRLTFVTDYDAAIRQVRKGDMFMFNSVMSVNCFKSHLKEVNVNVKYEMTVKRRCVGQGQVPVRSGQLANLTQFQILFTCENSL